MWTTENRKRYPWAGRKPSMAIGLRQDGKFLRGNFDFVLARGF
jgi:catechol 1,2-dioxygenase